MGELAMRPVHRPTARRSPRSHRSRLAGCRASGCPRRPIGERADVASACSPAVHTVVGDLPQRAHPPVGGAVGDGDVNGFEDQILHVGGDSRRERTGQPKPDSPDHRQLGDPSHRPHPGPLASTGTRAVRSSQGRRRRRHGSSADHQTTPLRRRLPSARHRRPRRDPARRLTEEQGTVPRSARLAGRCLFVPDPSRRRVGGSFDAGDT